VAVLLLIPAAVWLASNASDEDEPTATGTSGTTTDTTPSTPPPALKAVPDVAGVRLVEARSLLDDAGFRAQVRFEPSDRPEGEILGQAPRGGEDARPNAIVVLTVSGGPEQVTVPDVEGLTADAASRALRAAGLQPEIRLVRSKEAAGTVLEQTPAADEEVDPGSVVQLEVAEAAPEPATIEVPDVIGLRAADARRELRELGLRSTVAKVASGDPKGTVVGQSPGAGAKLREGATVRLRVSAGPAQVTVPDVTGLDEESARQQLEAAGFDVQIVDEPTSDATQDGLVVSQTPTGGTRGEKGSRVTLSIARFA
jgi:serine/threonine-protein kinase